MKKYSSGEKLFLVPFGNRKSRGAANKHCVAIVESAARVFVHVTIGDNNYSHKFRMSENAEDLHDEANGGYHAFRSEQDAIDFIRKQAIIPKIINKITSYKALESIAIEDIEYIAKILNLSD